MSKVRPALEPSSASRGFDAAERLNRAEQTVLVIAVGGAVLSTVIGSSLEGRLFAPLTLLDLALTATFAVFLFSPPLAVTLFAVAMVPAFLSGWDGPAFTALALAAGVVVRTGSTRLIFVFAGLLLLSAAKIVILQPSEPVVIGVGLLVAVVSGLAGFLLRSARGREQRLNTAVQEHASAMAQARREERLLIADELHDVIAHDLTVIAMQARVMERQNDPAMRAQTQREIGDAARRALRDIRRLIVPGVGETSAERIDDLEVTLADMTTTLRNAGYSPEVTAELDEPMPRLVDAALSRVLRESTTNVMKHGRVGPVRIRVGADEQTAWLQVANAHGSSRGRDRLPSGGFGSTRLAERMGVLGGEFSQLVEGDQWVVRATLPMT